MGIKSQFTDITIFSEYWKKILSATQYLITDLMNLFFLFTRRKLTLQLMTAAEKQPTQTNQSKLVQQQKILCTDTYWPGVHDGVRRPAEDEGHYLDHQHLEGLPGTGRQNPALLSSSALANHLLTPSGLQWKIKKLFVCLFVCLFIRSFDTLFQIQTSNNYTLSAGILLFCFTSVGLSDPLAQIPWLTY